MNDCCQRIAEQAWDAGHRAGTMWDHTQHTDEAYSPDANPYRPADGGSPC